VTPLNLLSLTSLLFNSSSSIESEHLHIGIIFSSIDHNHAGSACKKFKYLDISESFLHGNNFRVTMTLLGVKDRRTKVMQK
jgi:hypothetical protein